MPEITPEQQQMKDKLTRAGFRVFDPPGELDGKYVAAARTHRLLQDGELEVDEGAVVSASVDEGAYVLSWLWISDSDTGEPTAQCQNCKAAWLIERLNPIKDIHQRVAPGEIMPAGECPRCGALCHIQKVEEHNPCS